MNAMRRQSIYVLCFLLLAIAAPYLPAVDGPFLWDDRPLFLGEGGTQVRPPLSRKDPFAVFLRPFWQPGATSKETISFYRPLITLSYELDLRLHGENPVGFHLTNLAFHLLNCALLYLLCRRHGAPQLLGAAAVLLWGLFPRLTESVTWISGRTDVLATTFCLLALLLHRPTLGRRLLSALCIGLGLLCKEVAAAAALALALCEVEALPAGPMDLRDLRRLALRLTPLALCCLGYGLLRTHVLSSVVRDGPGPLPPWLRLIHVPEALGAYALMLIDPWHPATQIGLLGKPEALPTLLGGLLLLSGVPLAFFLVRTRRSPSSGGPSGRPSAWPSVWIGAALSLSALSLVLHVLPLPVDVVAADRFLYVPLCGVLVALSPALGALHAPQRGAMMRRGVLCGMLCLGASFGLAVMHRNLDFRDEVRFWVDALRRTRPDNGRPALELGNVYYRAGLFTDALRLYQRAVAAVGTAPVQQGIAQSATSNQANCLSQLGRYEDARLLRRFLISAQPQVPQYHHDLGLLYLHEERYEDARAALRQAIALYPNYRNAQVLLRTIDQLEADAGEPADPVARAERLTRLGRRPDAEAAWVAVAAAPASSAQEVRKALGYLVLHGKAAQAQAALQRVQAMAPGDRESAGLALLVAERASLEARLVAARPAIFGAQ
jgi:tetratricopeptide (TPR) repeat protein